MHESNEVNQKDNKNPRKQEQTEYTIEWYIIARIATSSRQLAEIRVLLYGMRIIEFITAFNCSSSWHKISLYACANVGNKYCILFNKLNIETECEQPIKKTLEKTGEKNSDTISRFEKKELFFPF